MQDAYFSEADRPRGGHAALDRHIDSLKADLHETSDLEQRARNLADRLTSGLQASQLVQHSSAVSDAFCRSRLEANGSHSYVALPRDVDFRSIIDRAGPR
jgi:putative acyl-CoA dehydrogenase